MIFKFRRSVAIVVVCAILFVLSTFVPSTRATPLGGFMHGFSLGMGSVALIAAIYFRVKVKAENREKEAKSQN